MDDFELKPERKSRFNAKSLIWNILTILVLLGIACLGWYFVTIFLNPNSPLNPFPPKPLPTLYKSPTPTITPIKLEPTWTETPTQVPSATRTRAPTWTLLPGMITPTITNTPEDTPIPSETPIEALATADVTYKASTDVHPDSDCKWLGVAGQVLDVNKKPLIYQTIQVIGTLDGKSVQFTTLSGTTPKALYGEAGFEVVLSDHPIASTQSLWIQLFDNTSQPLTDKVYFDTFTDCAKNLVFIVFTKTK